MVVVHLHISIEQETSSDLIDFTIDVLSMDFTYTVQLCNI